jgi:hypothetical protein
VEAISSVEGAEELLISLKQSQTGGIVVAVCAGPPVRPGHYPDLERVFAGYLDDEV